MFSIVTKFLGPTNTQGSRIRATCNGKSKMVSYDHAMGSVENHIEAVKEFARVFHYSGTYAIGETETGYIFTPTNHTVTL